MKKTSILLALNFWLATDLYAIERLDRREFEAIPYCAGPSVPAVSLEKAIAWKTGSPDSIRPPNIGSPDSIRPPNIGSPDSIRPPNIGSPDSIRPPNIGSPDPGEVLPPLQLDVAPFQGYGTWGYEQPNFWLRIREALFGPNDRPKTGWILLQYSVANLGLVNLPDNAVTVQAKQYVNGELLPAGTLKSW
jgi:hypothetical protein